MGDSVEEWYERIKDHTAVMRRIKPVSIMFSEYFFYFSAFIKDENVKKSLRLQMIHVPTIYQIDRIKNLKVLEDRFSLPYKAALKKERSERESNSCIVVS